MPALNQAVDSLKALNKNDVVEMKSFAKPPALVQVCACACGLRVRLRCHKRKSIFLHLLWLGLGMILVSKHAP